MIAGWRAAFLVANLFAFLRDAASARKCIELMVTSTAARRTRAFISFHPNVVVPDLAEARSALCGTFVFWKLQFFFRISQAVLEYRIFPPGNIQKIEIISQFLLRILTDRLIV